MRRFFAVLVVVCASIVSSGVTPSTAAAGDSPNDQVNGALTGNYLNDDSKQGCPEYRAFDAPFQATGGGIGLLRIDVCHRYQGTEPLCSVCSAPTKVYSASGTYELKTPSGDTLGGTVRGIYKIISDFHTHFEFTYTLADFDQYAAADGTIKLEGGFDYLADPTYKSWVFGTLTGSLVKADYPSAPPTQVSAVAGNRRATVSWKASTQQDIYGITGYIVTPFTAVEQPSQTFSTTDTTQVVTGLTNGETYTFRVRATHAAGGVGHQSLESNAVTPK